MSGHLLQKGHAYGIREPFKQLIPIQGLKALADRLDNGSPFSARRSDPNEAKELFTDPFLVQKLTCLHGNPVRAGIVDYPEEYRYSSARNYVGKQGLLEVIVI
ncbi:hypothetical protein ACS5NO_30025 [Larkinella sp. GY13]|uniref:hypothetical protein n=1 Tax=Larkinella sp. GY13 TaxID=3453720 RepID=UPI003EEC2ACD